MRHTRRGVVSRALWGALIGLSATIAAPALGANVAAAAPAAPAAPVKAAAPSAPVTSSAPATTAEAQVEQLCSDPAPGHFQCFAEKVVGSTNASHGGDTGSGEVTPSGYGPSDIQGAYKLPSATTGAGRTVAIVDAYDLPTAESDLAVYRAQYGLPACTTANGCFRKINQSGGTTPPAADAGWGGEIALDLDMVSATCPLCNILLVEASSASISNLGTAVNQAVSQGAVAVSNSYGGGEGNDTFYDTQYYKHPGVAITASTGDDGYGTSYPAASPWVTAVGGTSLTKASGTTRGWSESAWSGAGSGCTTGEAKPSFQTDSGCAKRTVADVSAVADPNTGVAVYDTYQNPGWQVYGGTSASSPIVASVYAMATRPPAAVFPVAYPYATRTALFDVTTGNNGSCSGSYLCTSMAGYDGPTGLGTPNGTNAFSPPAVVPGAPTIGTATAGNGQATVTWTAPASDGGSAITGYTVTPSIGGVAQAPQAFASTATSQTISGLANGTTYTFKVAATNSIGTGTASAASNAVTPAAPTTVPGAPTIGTATAGNGQATVTWTVPASDGGSAITGYSVTPSIGGVAQAPRPFASTATSQVLTGLTNGSTYTFTVAATNGNGTGADSTASNAVTIGVPTAPTVTAGVSGDGTVKLTWTAAGANGASVTGYVVTPAVGGVAQAPKSFASTATTQTITGLTNGTSYTFTVAGTNARGPGLPSAPSAAIPAGLPATPGFQSSVSGNASAKVSWLAPAANGSPITGYVITPFLSGVAQAPQTFNTTTTNDVVTGLTNGQTYTFKIQAKNAVGTGPLSSPTTAVIIGLPAAPGFTAGTSLDSSSKVSWWAPSGNGSAITGYVITPYLGTVAQPAQTFNTTATSDLVTGLTNGQTYTFKVQAKNAYGTGSISSATAPVLIGLPATPGFLSTASLDSSAKVAWLAPSGNGSAITGYIVTPYLSGVAQAPQSFNSTATSVVATGLTNGQTYTFKVTAVNSVGAGTPSSFTPSVLVGLPSAPGFLKVVSQSGAAKLSWWAPSGNGSPITGYVITPYLSGVAQPAQTFNTAANSDVVTGLTNGQTYTFKVAAINAVGTGALGSVTATI